MNVTFSANALRKGDQGYEYDKRVDFDTHEGDDDDDSGSDWDM